MYMIRNISTHSDVRSQTPAGAYKLIIINTFLCIAMCVCVRSGGWTASHHLFVCLYLSLSLNWHFTARFFSFRYAMNPISWAQFSDHKNDTNFVVYRLKRNITLETIYFGEYFTEWRLWESVFIHYRHTPWLQKKLMNISIIFTHEVRYSSLKTLLKTFQHNLMKQ